MATPPLYARPPTDPAEDRRLRKLAASRHAPASWIQRARIVTGSWDGATVPEVAASLGCHPKTVSKWLHRFNAHGLDGLADLPRPGAPRRLTEHQRGRIIQLAGCTRGVRGCWLPPSPRHQRTGPWTPWPRPPRRRASGWAAARSARSCWPRAPAGGAPGRGRPAPTPTSSPKSPRHRLLHQPAAANDRDLRRRARAGHPPQLPTGARLEAGRPPGQSPAGLRPRAGEDLGLRRAARG